MMFKTHIAFGFLLGLIAISYLNPRNQILFISLAVIASALPDIDHPKSKLGKKVKIIGLLFEHRGFFHSLLFLIPLFLLLSGVLNNIYIYAILIGYVSHIIMDAITKEGIMPFHPISKIRIKGFIKTGHLAEYVIFLLIFVFSIYKLINL